ncbi:MAG: PepSY domain-containing protein [Chloroflexia bacterium]
MTQRLAFAGAAGLAAFSIMLLGALAAYVVLHMPPVTAASAPQSAVAAPAQEQAAPPSSSFQDQSGQQSSPSSPPASGQSQSGAYPVSADDATTIALNSVPGASLSGQPRLVNFGGIVAYEVPLDAGTVYVDANQGQVLRGGLGGRRRHSTR